MSDAAPESSVSPPRPRLGVLFSGGGRTLENLARCVKEGSLLADIPIAISSHAGAGGLDRAREAGIPAELIDFREFREAPEEHSARVLERLEATAVDWIILAGYIRQLHLSERWRGRVLNIHPSLLPAYGGRGYYGSRVHRAVLAAGERVSGCTVHFVDEEYDRGPIILQRVVPVLAGDREDDLAERVFREECRAYPEALRLVLADRVRVDEGRARIVER